MRNKKLTIGITGGIGSGKSLVAKQFTELGINVLEADQVTRELVLPGTYAFEEITQKFGVSLLKVDGTIHRQQLGEIIFRNPPLRKWLENLLHPLVRQRMAEFIKQSTSPYCILVIPLLVENLPNPLVNRILVVDSSATLQRLRTNQRDHLTQPQITAILDNQTSRSNRLAVADDIIENFGDIATLVPQIHKLHELYLDLSRQ